jgi:hypothetical protein
MGRFPFRLTGGGYVLRPSPLRWTSVESASSAGANYRTAEVGRQACAGAPAALLPLVRGDSAASVC